MKKCPTCARTFDDALKFCQIDGTPLVDAGQSAPEDSFKTMVDASIPSNQNELNWEAPAENSARNVSPPSPFDDEIQTSDYGSPFSPSFGEPEPKFNPPQPSFNQSPFENPSSPSFGNQPEWTPPPAPVSEWQNQNIGVNSPFQPPTVGQSEDKTLAIVSLVCGILSVTCCGAITGIVALITGFMAKNNVDANPQQYGGRGMALAGMIMGGIGIVLTVLWLVFVVIGGVLR